MLGDIPDLQAIELRRGPAEESKTFETPPMLRRSWELVVKASRQRASLVPANSLAGRVGRNIAAARPWLVHRVTAIAQDHLDEPDLAQAEHLLSKIAALATRSRRDSVSELAAGKTELSGLETSILAASASSPVASEDEMPEDHKKQWIQQLLQDLDAPSFTIAQSIQNLFKKLDLD